MLMEMKTLQIAVWAAKFEGSEILYVISTSNLISEI